MNNNELEQKIMESPKIIYQKEIELMKEMEKKITQDKLLEDIYTTVKQDVSMEKETDGKRTYPNEDSRAAEIQKRIRVRLDAETGAKILKEISDTVRISELELKFAINEFSALKSVARLRTKEE